VDLQYESIGMLCSEIYVDVTTSAIDIFIKWMKKNRTNNNFYETEEKKMYADATSLDKE